jgi:uncharacterized protein
VTSAVELDALAIALRTSPALRAKRGIGLVGEVFGVGSWVHGPGDDGAVVTANGMQEGCRIYDVPLVGGHLTLHDGAPALSAFGIGWARQVLSATRVAPGQTLIVACCTQGAMRSDFPFFASFDDRGAQLGADVRVLAAVAESGACIAAKDVSMAGLIGSLAMLLEWSQTGITVDLDAVPRPPDVALESWLACFPAFAFLLCAPAGRESDCLHAFRDRGLDAAAVGEVDATGVLAVRQGGRRAAVLDMRVTSVTGLRR